MFSALTPILTLLAAAAVNVRADPSPSSPGPGQVFIQGDSCPITWEVDPTGSWKNMNIDLMTGDNFNMVFLTSVATNVDGTNLNKNTFSYPCPEVSPHSAIYFYQFSAPSSSSNKTWTARFAITDAVNNVVAPSQSTQPDGEKIPWGTGSLVNGPSSAAPVTFGTPVADPDITTPSTPSPTPSSHTPTSTGGNFTAIQSVASGVLSAAEANGVVTTLSVSNIFFQTGLALGLAAFGFIVMY